MILVLFLFEIKKETTIFENQQVEHKSNNFRLGGLPKTSRSQEECASWDLEWAQIWHSAHRWAASEASAIKFSHTDVTEDKRRRLYWGTDELRL